MNRSQKAVWDWQNAVGLGNMNNDRPNISELDQKTLDLRADLIREEVEELIQALKDKDLVEVADALGDILFVVYGAGCTFGIDLQRIFDEVTRSNMTKVGADSNNKGKLGKGANFEPPNIKEVLDTQQDLSKTVEELA